MKRIFVETSGFTKEISKISDGPELLQWIQNFLLLNLEAGDVVQGTGGNKKALRALVGILKGKGE